VDQPDRHRIQEVELLATAPPGHHQAGFLEQLQMLHHAETGHLEASFERAQALPVVAEKLIQQSPPRRVGQGLEHIVHASRV